MNLNKVLFAVLLIIVMFCVVPASATVNLRFTVIDAYVDYYDDIPPACWWGVDGYLDTGGEVVSRVEWAYPINLGFYYDGGNATGIDFHHDGNFFGSIVNDYPMAAISNNPEGFNGITRLSNIWAYRPLSPDWPGCTFNPVYLHAFRPDGSQITDISITPTTLNPIPEPSCLLALSGGLIGILGMIRKRK